jgi:hypothetical protein
MKNFKIVIGILGFPLISESCETILEETPVSLATADGY